MSIHRRAAKRDSNESEIVERLRQLGAVVVRLSGAGVPDLLISWRGISRIAEVKRPKGKLTQAQIIFHREWSGEPVPILTGPDDATTWLLSLTKAAARETHIHDRHHDTMKALEDA